MNVINPLLPKNAQGIFIKGPVGLLDTLEQKPKGEIAGVAIILHPDPKNGGTYTNKIVQTVAKVMNNKGYICYCPNLRGVGQSDGVHDFGVAEVEDARAIYSYAVTKYPDLPVLLAGFSFGTAVISNLAMECEFKHLVLIGPAVTRYRVAVPDSTKTLVIHGQDDEIIPLDEVYAWACKYDIPISVFARTGHFFHGKLVILQNYLNQIISG